MIMQSTEGNSMSMQRLKYREVSDAWRELFLDTRGCWPGASQADCSSK
jgi:hypothetical protein